MIVQPKKRSLGLLFGLTCLFSPIQPITVANATIVVEANRVVRQKPKLMGGTMIEWHDVPSPLVTNQPINFRRDIQQNRIPLIRLGSYPSPRNRAQTLADFDAKVKAILQAGAVPLFYVPIKPGLPYRQANGKPGGTVASHVVFLAQHYQSQPFRLRQQYWEVGNEPDIAIDHRVKTTTEYIEIFKAVHQALVKAKLRDRITLMGPATSRTYQQGTIQFADQLMNDFLAQCHDIVDVVTWHHYANLPPTQPNWQYLLLNQPTKLDNIYNAHRRIDRSNRDWGSPTADIGMAALLDRMRQYSFARGGAIGITEHNAAPVHSIQAGLWNLAVSHFLLYGDRSHPVVLDNTFIFNQFGKQYDFPLYTSNLKRNYSNWALWINGNLRGSQLLSVSVSGNLNRYGNPHLLVTATQERSSLYVEVINRNSSPITDTVMIQDWQIKERATLYRMAEGTTPDKSTPLSVQQRFSHTFPAYSVTIFEFRRKN